MSSADDSFSMFFLKDSARSDSTAFLLTAINPVCSEWYEDFSMLLFLWTVSKENPELKYLPSFMAPISVLAAAQKEYLELTWDHVTIWLRRSVSSIFPGGFGNKVCLLFSFSQNSIEILAHSVSKSGTRLLPQAKDGRLKIHIILFLPIIPLFSTNRQDGILPAAQLLYSFFLLARVFLEFYFLSTDSIRAISILLHCFSNQLLWFWPPLPFCCPG